MNIKKTRYGLVSYSLGSHTKCPTHTKVVPIFNSMLTFAKRIPNLPQHLPETTRKICQHTKFSSITQGIEPDCCGKAQIKRSSLIIIIIIIDHFLFPYFLMFSQSCIFYFCIILHVVFFLLVYSFFF